MTWGKEEGYEGDNEEDLAEEEDSASNYSAKSSSHHSSLTGSRSGLYLELCSWPGPYDRRGGGEGGKSSDEIVVYYDH